MHLLRSVAFSDELQLKLESAHPGGKQYGRRLHYLLVCVEALIEGSTEDQAMNMAELVEAWDRYKEGLGSGRPRKDRAHADGGNGSSARDVVPQTWGGIILEDGTETRKVGRLPATPSDSP